MTWHHALPMPLLMCVCVCWCVCVLVCVQQLAPENTQMSFERAVETGAEGLETDVTIRLA